LKNAAYYEVIKEHADCGQVLLHGGLRRWVMLDIKRDKFRFDLPERQAARLAPVEKLVNGAGVCKTGVLVTDVGKEELNKTPGRALTGMRDDSRENVKADLG
jgi:hypothetical protein